MVSGQFTQCHYTQCQYTHDVWNFQHDSARPHSALQTANCLREIVVRKLPWLSYSRDLKSIEHLWNQSSAKINSQPESICQLKKTKKIFWITDPQSEIRALVQSMSHGIRACRINKSSHHAH